MELDSSLLFWLLALTGVTLTGISKSGFAGGAGVVAVPLMAMVMPVSDAIVVMLPLLLAMDIKMIHYYAQAADWKLLRKIVPGAVVGITLGGFLLGTLSDRFLELSLAAICLLFASWQSLTPLLSRFKGSAVFWSLFSGFSSTLIHAGGPPINLYLLSLKLEKLRWLATSAFFFGAMNLIKLLPYTLNDQWSQGSLILSALLLPAALLGVWLGKLLQKYISERFFLHAIRLLLILTGLSLLFKGSIS